MYEYVSLGNDTKSLGKYFRKYKNDIIKYHVVKRPIRARELSDNSDKFYNNSVESLNKLINRWQIFQKTDLLAFSKKYEELSES